MKAIELIRSVIFHLDISDHLDAEDILNISSKLKEALRELEVDKL